MKTYENIIVHTSDASYRVIPRQFEAINRWHKERWPEFISSLGYWGGYHLLIEPDGAEKRYREDSEETAAAVGYNLNSLHVCLAFDGDSELPTPQQVEALRARLGMWCEVYDIPRDMRHIFPHRKVAPQKTCYGSLLADDWAARLLAPTPKPPPQEKNKESIEAQKRTLLLQLVELYKKLLELLQKGRNS